MFSKRITSTGKFLRLDPKIQALYFHLGMNADDEGFVEAFPVMRMIGCGEDELDILEEKNYIKVLNEDLVVYITDWNENNFIRNDRKVDSIYHDLLPSDPEEEKEEETKEEAKAEQTSNQAEDTCQPNDNQVTTNCQPNDGISKDKLSKDKLINKEIGEQSTSDNVKSFIDYQSIVDLYHSICISLPKIKYLTPERKQKLKGLLSRYDPKQIEEAFAKTQESPFLRGECNGEGHDAWRANFDWIIDQKHFVKILEGNYDRRGQPMDSGMDYAAIEQQLMEN